MFQRLQIRYKLLAVLLVPLVALTIFALVRVGGDVRSGSQAARVDRLTAFAGNVTGLIQELQAERDNSLGYVAASRRLGRDGLANQRGRVDQAILAFRRELRTIDLASYDQLLRERLGDAQELLNQLGNEREVVDVAPPSGLARTQLYYSDITAALLDFNTGITSESNDRQLIRTASSFVLLSRLKEFASQERALIYTVLAADRISPAQFEQLVSTIGTQDSLVAQFQSSASREERSFYASLIVSTNLPKLGNLRRAVLAASTAGQISAEGFSGPEGVRGALGILTEEVDRLRRVEVRVAADVSDASRSKQAAARRAAVLDSFLTVLVLALAVGVSLLMSQSMARPLLRLRDVANQVARRQLPEVVQRLQRGELTHLDVRAAPIEIQSGDETGQVALAFNAVHQVAVEVAAEQAALRLSIGDMFLNLARRSQTLIDRQLELIEELEQDAEPEVLEQLFRLDHLATRMRRNAENLIVLSGAEPPRSWSQPVPLGEVVRAAMGEIEDYQRVELLPIDDVGLAGHAVADAVHLLAELIENATSLSPPGTRVQIAGQEAANGYVLEIEDRGLGMSDEELVDANERLANPPAIDSALSRMLGLYVVGRLAVRHGIKVQLRHSWYGGVTALVLVPHALTTWSGTHGSRELGAPMAPPASPDALPIFEATRSEWFDSGVSGRYLPMRRHAPQHAADDATAGGGGERDRAPGPADLAMDFEGVDTDRPAHGRHESANGHGAGPVGAGGYGADDSTQPFAWPPIGGDGASQLPPSPAPSPASPSPSGSPLPQRHAPDRRQPPQRPVQRRPEAAPPSPDPQRPPEAPHHAGPSYPEPPPPPTPQTPPPPTPQTPPPPTPQTPPPPPQRQHTAPAPNGARVTHAGLPRRVPRANMAPGIPDQPPPSRGEPASSVAASLSRSPEEIRAMLSSYRSGLERGRRMAGNDQEEAGWPDAGGADSGYWGPTMPRSSDDPAQ